ncbi:Transposase [Ktedonobacter racemifer DSM 44963]|uniref:Transposase n=1 Tax=Ktedonobacter racemifer DSM 44963 TaxID=485913 RepID=D6TWT8_KTERA|nr:Transposase [Ktedonobacter racemifer DSM 44963]
MAEQHPFKWRHFQADIILLCVRWYLRYALSYSDLEEMMFERGLPVDHTTIYRWVQHYAPELERRCRANLKITTDSWRVDETYIKVKKEWMYLYRAVDSRGNTLDFFFSSTRDTQAAKQFLLKTLTASCDLQTPLAKSGGICFTSASARIASQTMFESSFRLRPLLDLPKRVLDENTAAAADVYFIQISLLEK